jgi:hypothetical protein
MGKGNSKKQSISTNGGLNFEVQFLTAAKQPVTALNYRKTEYTPPFNMSDWSRGGGMGQDVRCCSLSASNGERAGLNNANYA